MDEPVFSDARQIGLRMALGAQVSDVQKLIVRQGMWLAAIGSLIGLALALIASDPIIFTFIAFTLLTIAFLAC